MTGANDEQAGPGPDRNRFDADAMTGRPVADAIEFYRAKGFWVVVSQDGDPLDLSLSPGRVRLVARDGKIVSARLG